MSELENLIFIQAAALVQFANGPLRSKIIFRCRSESGVNRAGDVGDNGLYLGPHLGALSLKLLFDFVRRFRNQLLEDMPGNVFAQPKMLCKNVVILGTLKKAQKAGALKVYHANYCVPVDDLGSATHGQNVGYIIGDGFSSRNS